jgi:Domain of unknown function (DUF4189)
MKRVCGTLLLLFVVFEIKAEGGCPDGYFPVGGGNAGWQGCAPMDTGGAREPANPGPRWASRWGAIAAGGGGFGAPENAPSKRRAEKAALKQCKATAGKSGSACQVITSYYNQCAAISWGDNGKVGWASAPEIADAKAASLDTCGKNTTNCKLHYAGCSYPERVH